MLLFLLPLAAGYVPESPAAAVASPPMLEFHLVNADGQPGSVSSNLYLDTSSHGGRTLFCVRCPALHVPPVPR